jgi:hypothetical protein
LRLKKHIENLFGCFQAKVIDTVSLYRSLEVNTNILEFSQLQKSVTIEITFKDRISFQWFKEKIKINVEAFAHNSQNMVPRFMKMIRDKLNKEVESSVSRNYGNYSEFLIDSLPQKDLWQEAGLYQYNLPTIQEIKRLMVVLLLRKTVGVYSLVGFRFEPQTEQSIQMHLLMHYFKEKNKQARVTLRNTVVEIQEQNLENQLLSNLVPEEASTPITWKSRSNLSSPTNSLRTFGKTFRNVSKKKGFMVTNPTLSGLHREKKYTQYLRSKDFISKYLGWQDHLEEDNLDWRNDKLAIKSRPLEIINLKHEHEFYQCLLHFTIQNEALGEVKKRESQRLILSDFCLTFSILSRSGEVLHKRDIKTDKIAEFLGLEEHEVLNYCLIKLSKSAGKVGQQLSVIKSVVAVARKILINRQTIGEL